MIWNFIIQLIIAIALTAASYLLTPHPGVSSDANREPEAPTSESGREITKAWGSPLIESPNVLGQWDKSTKGPYGQNT